MEPKVALGPKTGRDYHTLYGFCHSATISSRTESPNLGSSNPYARGESYNSPNNASASCKPTSRGYEPLVAYSTSMLKELEISSSPTKEHMVAELKEDESTLSSISLQAKADELIEYSGDSEIDEDDEMGEEDEDEDEEDDKMEDYEDEYDDDAAETDDSLSSASSDTLPATSDSPLLNGDDQSDNDSDNDSESTITTGCSSIVDAASATATPMSTPASSFSDKSDIQMSAQSGSEQEYSCSEDEDYENDSTDNGSRNLIQIEEQARVQLLQQPPLPGQLPQEQQQEHPSQFSTVSEEDCLRKAKSTFKGQEYRRNQGYCFLQLQFALMHVKEWIRPTTPLSEQNAKSSRLTYQKRDLLIGGTEFVWRYIALQKRIDRIFERCSSWIPTKRLIERINRKSKEDGLAATVYAEKEMRKLRMKIRMKFGSKLRSKL